MKELIKNRFPDLYDDNLLNLIEKKAIFKTVDSGSTIIDYGQKMRHIPLVMSGCIRIVREDENGNELLLYFLEKGDTCAVSLTCCMSNQASSIRAIADDETEMLLIPIEYMDEWMNAYPAWKSFVMNTYQKRFNELLKTIDLIAFHNMDDRLLQYLKEKSRLHKSKTIEITHQEIAYSLNASREAISRLLKKLEMMNTIKLGRNKITLL